MESQHAATHHIEMATPSEADSCSATAIGPHALLTAAHCLEATDSVSVDGVQMPIVKIIYDRSEHVILVVQGSFPSWVPVEARDLAANEQVHLWGNPHHNRDVFRVGEFWKHESFDGEDGATYDLQVFILPIFPGDSGSGVFDAAGRVVAVISLGGQSADAACFPIRFTAEQLKSIQ